MNSFIGIIMSLWFAFLSFVGIPFSAPDLEAGAPVFNETASEENLALFKRIFDTETAWLASLQLENGAIPMTVATDGVLRMNPYFADFAAMALLDKPEEYADNVRRYMDWHFTHLNTAQEDFNGLDGTIYDYSITVSDGEIVQEIITLVEGQNSYDSTDSYAATFLSLLNKYRVKTGDTVYLFYNRTDILRVINAMLATFHKGLTYAKPNYTVKYLMDNCEVYRATLDTVELLRAVFGTDDEEICRISQLCESVAHQIEHAVNYKLWNFVGGHYTTQVTKFGIQSEKFSWQLYYPCATAQLFPIIFGLINPESVRAYAVYSEFCEEYTWENFDIPDVFYWGSNVQAAAKMNDLPRVIAYMINYEKLMEKHEYPLYNADIAKVSMAAYEMLQRHTSR